MSLAADSPVHSSSSSDDFAAFLDGELEAASSDTSPDDEQVNDDDEDDNSERRSKRHKTKELEGVESGQVSTMAAMDKKTIGPSGAHDNIDICPPHPGFFKGLCMRCGQLEEDDGSGVAFGYIHKDLKLGSEEIERLRGADLKTLLHKKKLILILDLDHTLLNSTHLSDVYPDEEYLLKEANSNDPARSLFKLNAIHMLTKLRPFTHQFLKEASSIFEMYIYTMAERAYALEIAKLIDPENIYFASKIITQADCTQRHQKGLDVVLGAENMVVILDDTEFVWQRHKGNLIHMEKYNFFTSSCRQNNVNAKSLSEMMKDESETDGALANVLSVLKRTHEMFFDPVPDSDLSARDVREILKTIQQEVLRGCKIVFSRVFPNNLRVQDEPIWKMAERLGAECCKEVDSSVTHVVATDVGTEKSRWAVRDKKFLVNPHWIAAANFLWCRQREEDFPVPKVSP